MEIKFLLFSAVCIALQILTIGYITATAGRDDSEIISTAIERDADSWSLNTAQEVKCLQKFHANRPDRKSHFWNRLLLCFHVPSVLLSGGLEKDTRTLLEERVRLNVSALTCAVSCSGRFQKRDSAAPTSRALPARSTHWWESEKPILMEESPKSSQSHNEMLPDSADADFKICSASDFKALLPKCKEIIWDDGGTTDFVVYYE